MSIPEKQGGMLGAAFLVTGSCIGVGMLGLPVVSAMAGFIPTSLAMIITYFFATTTGLLLMEATLWYEHKTHLISIARSTLGNMGKWVMWCFFLFLFYCLLVAYIEGSGQLFTSLLSNVFQQNLPRELGIFVSVFTIGIFVYIGAIAVSRASRIFLLGAGLAYSALVVLGIPHIKAANLAYENWRYAASTIPILFICFGYQNLIPTIVHYTRRNVKAVRRAIYIGNAIPFAVYSLWNFVILGILSDASHENLSRIVNHGEMVTGLLQQASESPSILMFASIFSFFTVLTPFMVSTLSFVDFFKDGLKNFPNLQRDVFVYGIILIPPTLCTLLYPHLFLSALGFAGGFIDAVLFGILPVLMVYVGRYVKKMRGPFEVAGGKPLLTVVFLFTLSVMVYRLTTMFMP